MLTTPGGLENPPLYFREQYPNVLVNCLFVGIRRPSGRLFLLGMP